MYIIEETEYGIYVRMSGKLERNDMEKYVKEKEKIIESLNKSFSILVDIRNILPFSDEETKTIVKSQKESGSILLRMAIIVSASTLIPLANDILELSKIKDKVRFIDSSIVANWEAIGHNWVINGTEPSENIKISKEKV